MKEIRVGVLGAAKIALGSVIPALQAGEGVTCAGIASQRPGVAAELARKLGIPLAFDSYQALLESPEIDAVYIPLANGDHREWTERAAAAGKHILCEKPLGLNAAEAEAMFVAAERHGVRLLEAFSYYFNPQHQRVLELLAAGTVGTPTHFRARFSFPLMSAPVAGDRLNVRLDPGAGGAGAMMDIGCYGVHAARRVFGGDPIAVTAHSTFTDQGVDVATSAVLEFSGGRLAVVDVSFAEYDTTEYEVSGLKGTIRLPKGYANQPRGTEFPIEIRTEAGERIETLPYVDQVELMVEHFGRLIRDPELAPFTPKSETLGIMRVLDAVAESARTGRRVTLA